MGSLAVAGSSEGFFESAAEPIASASTAEVDGSEVDSEIDQSRFMLPAGTIVLGRGCVLGLGASVHAGTELGLPMELGGVAAQPLVPPGDSSLDLGESSDGSLGVGDLSVAPLNISGLGSSVAQKLREPHSLRPNPQGQPVDGFVIGPAEQALPCEGFEFTFRSRKLQSGRWQWRGPSGGVAPS